MAKNLPTSLIIGVTGLLIIIMIVIIITTSKKKKSGNSNNNNNNSNNSNNNNSNNNNYPHNPAEAKLNARSALSNAIVEQQSNKLYISIPLKQKLEGSNNTFNCKKNDKITFSLKKRINGQMTGSELLKQDHTFTSDCSTDSQGFWFKWQKTIQNEDGTTNQDETYFAKDDLYKSGNFKLNIKYRIHHLNQNVDIDKDIILTQPNTGQNFITPRELTDRKFVVTWPGQGIYEEGGKYKVTLSWLSTNVEFPTQSRIILFRGGEWVFDQSTSTWTASGATSNVSALHRNVYNRVINLGNTEPGIDYAETGTVITETNTKDAETPVDFTKSWYKNKSFHPTHPGKYDRSIEFKVYKSDINVTNDIGNLQAMIQFKIGNKEWGEWINLENGPNQESVPNADNSSLKFEPFTNTKYKSLFSKNMKYTVSLDVEDFINIDS